MKSATWSGTQMAVKIAPPAAAARTPRQRVVVSLIRSDMIGLRIGQERRGHLRTGIVSAQIDRATAKVARFSCSHRRLQKRDT